MLKSRDPGRDLPAQPFSGLQLLNELLGRESTPSKTYVAQRGTSDVPIREAQKKLIGMGVHKPSQGVC
eukprot:scaffold648035_cov28-Prasinocladus_malaysianus.AAC.1